MSILAPVYGYIFKRMTSRLARMGLTYHDAIADTGVYDQAISRLPPHMQVRANNTNTRAAARRAPHGVGWRRRAQGGARAAARRCRQRAAALSMAAAAPWALRALPRRLAPCAPCQSPSDDPLDSHPPLTPFVPQEERQRRMTRALDMSAKHTEMAVQVSTRAARPW